MKHFSAKELVTRESVVRANERLVGRSASSGRFVSSHSVALRAPTTVVKPSRQQFEDAGRRALKSIAAK
jgi:hypothetical protein